MVASYTANLAAFLVLDQPEKGLTGITDPRLRNPSANFSFGTVLNSNVYQYFKRHVELSTMFRKMEAHNVEKLTRRFHLGFYPTGFRGSQTLCAANKLLFSPQYFRGALFGRSAYGVGLQKNSPWTPHITSAILRMTEKSGPNRRASRVWPVRVRVVYDIRVAVLVAMFAFAMLHGSLLGLCAHVSSLLAQNWTLSTMPTTTILCID
ncbi:hypothetical protein TELCIR_08507 [Teladorsagia circumcincta]|uniref:Ionotropic glutamate receptor C-terminal domain-containing protein n=1 Tax=Teladorsagia circumcincta TaxID=45464 RepID=A0A2G9UHK9_TELCI|nr:hypothetical protein TELCIR_08507 [Teladorsagia circumcincta]